MKLTDGEKTLALVICVSGGTAELVALGDFFDRPARLRKAGAGLVAKGIATAPANMVRLTIDLEKLVNTLRIKRPLSLFADDDSGTATVTGRKKTVTEDVPGRFTLQKDSEPLRLLTASAERPKTGQNIGKTLRIPLPKTTGESELSTAGGAATLKERHKGIKPLTGLEELKEALRTLDSTGHEMSAYGAMCGILGGIVMEGGDLGKDGKERFGDGGKWLNRWRNSRARVHRVMAALIEEIAEGKVKSRGGRAQYIWNKFFET